MKEITKGKGITNAKEIATEMMLTIPVRTRHEWRGYEADDQEDDNKVPPSCWRDRWRIYEADDEAGPVADETDDAYTKQMTQTTLTFDHISDTHKSGKASGLLV